MTVMNTLQQVLRGEGEEDSSMDANEAVTDTTS